MKVVSKTESNFSTFTTSYRSCAKTQQHLIRWFHWVFSRQNRSTTIFKWETNFSHKTKVVSKIRIFNLPPFTSSPSLFETRLSRFPLHLNINPFTNENRINGELEISNFLPLNKNANFDQVETPQDKTLENENERIHLFHSINTSKQTPERGRKYVYHTASI